MTARGRLTDWNDDRGFGYITPLGGGPTVFVHVSQFPRAQRRPEVLDLVTYVVAADDRGRVQAHDVHYLAPTRTRTARVESSPALLPVPALAASLVFLAVLVVIAASGWAPWMVPAAYVALSAVTFVAYGFDKRAAEHGLWRTEESALHLLAFLGGWPGALVAQRFFHHKTVKQPFQTIFWVTVVANIALLTLILASLQTPAALG
jgi:uncharacterized membrane protein YsdA (DUF1294 family)/cold shock CspA family protein